jgi:hypothetical protein
MSERDYAVRRHLEFRYDRGSWLIRGLPYDTGSRFDDLADAVDYAKAECAAEPAWIELIVGDFHVMARQEPGWSRPLCCPSTQRPLHQRHIVPNA